MSMWLAVCSAVQCKLLRFCRDHKQHYMASKFALKCCLQRANMYMVSLGAHAQELIRCPCTIHQMRLKHTSSIVIQNCTEAATSRVATTIICTQVMLGKTFHLLNTCIMHRKLSFNSSLKSVSICLPWPPTSYNMLHQACSP